jgi:RNA polymerase sigma-70 factor (ECF subfamily)
MIAQSPDTEDLLRQAQDGDLLARQALLARHRDRLRRMVELRLDRRMAARVDPSDVVQEALMDADKRLTDYLKKRPVPFYPWLRRLAWEHLVKVHDRHVLTRKRSVLREEIRGMSLSEGSTWQLAERLAVSGTSASQRLIREEMGARVRAALARLSAGDREVLVLRYLEQLSTADIAAELEIGEGAVKMRHRRALDRLCRFLRDEGDGGDS